MLSENAIQLIGSIIKNNTDKENIVTEINLTDNYLECNAIGNTMSIENIFFDCAYNAFVCLRDFTDEETDLIRKEAKFEEFKGNVRIFRKGEIFLYGKQFNVDYVYYCKVNTDNVKEKTNKTNEPLQIMDIFERCQKVLDNCDNNKEIWEKVKKMVNIYLE